MNEKPYNVVLAIRIMWWLLAIELFRFITFISFGFLSTISDVLPLEKILFMSIGNLITILWLWLIIYFISRGKNWARLLYALLFCASIILMGRDLTNTPPLRDSLMAGYIGFQLLILWLLFHNDSTSWFQVKIPKE